MFYSTFYSNSLCYSFKKIAPPFTSLLYNVSSNMKNIKLVVSIIARKLLKSDPKLQDGEDVDVLRRPGLRLW